MPRIPDAQVLAEYRRLSEWSAAADPGPGRTTTLGWDLEYPTPGLLPTLLDYIVFRRVNDFFPDDDRPVILDCGANIGYTVLNYKRQFPDARIIAFEPDPQFAPMLRRNLERNGARDVEVVEAAAWIANGRSNWLMEGTDGSRMVSQQTTGARSVDVATVDLARYLERPVDLLKLDIEGAEFDVVPHIASRLQNVKNIVVECHVRDRTDYIGLSDILRTLADAGFDISLNSVGAWRDLIRRQVPGPLHAAQYFSVFGWRSEHPRVLREVTYEPHRGAAYYVEHEPLFSQAETISVLEDDNRRLTQLLADLATGSRLLDTVRMEGPFHREHGFCWVGKLPDGVPPSDSPTALSSPILLLENNRALGPAHTLHATIRERGRGRYSHWGSQFYFSTSDNSDPNTNGREYTLVWRRCGA